ncbi:glycosyltransferase family 4 protein [Cohnella fermenti]|uniref:Glycosyltransferase family 4 protein n=1 Tax=Cohnella fermenti TaxID=2565925 RepID=A0A4S4BQL1_9BACL|nr:glycosyltransferase family 4 protein [Cohnella fermenti]THF74898.1 glycosyltransferase family 4 protein [Cohnella fermenti]
MRDRMKILATGMEWHEHIPGGLNQYFADYLRAMVEQGHSVEGLISGEGRPLGAPPYVRDIAEAVPALTTMKRVRSFYRGVMNRSRVSEPDVFNPHFALYAAMVGRNSLPGHVPIVTHFHGPWSLESLVEEQGRSLSKLLKLRMKRRLEQSIYRRSDSFIVLSDYFRDVLSKEFGVSGSRIHVIPGAVDTERFKPAANRGSLRAQLGIRPGERLLVCARRLVRRMGIDHLIRAMVRLSQETPSIRLGIIGDGPLRGELQELIESLGLQGNVRLLGRVGTEELVSWYQAADLAIVPTVTLEGFGLVTAEALACGTPVLGTPYGGTKEILQKLSAELLFADGSPEAIARKVAAVLNGTERAPQRDACREHVLRHYTWDKIAVRIAGAFGEAIESRKECRTYESGFKSSLL